MEDLKDFVRVSKVLEPYSNYYTIPRHILEKAQDRGTRAHFVVQSIIEGLEPFEIDADIEPYVESFRGWYSPDRLGPSISIEKRFFHNSEAFTGQVDLLDKSRETLYDFKTSQTYSRSWALQLGAYYWLAEHNGFHIEKAVVVQLMKSGEKAQEYRFDLDHLSTAKIIFKQALDLYRYFNGENHEDK